MGREVLTPRNTRNTAQHPESHHVTRGNRVDVCRQPAERARAVGFRACDSRSPDLPSKRELQSPCGGRAGRGLEGLILCHFVVRALLYRAVFLLHKFVELRIHALFCVRFLCPQTRVFQYVARLPPRPHRKWLQGLQLGASSQAMVLPAVRARNTAAAAAGHEQKGICSGGGWFRGSCGQRWMGTWKCCWGLGLGQLGRVGVRAGGLVGIMEEGASHPCGAWRMKGAGGSGGVLGEHQGSGPSKEG